MISYTLSAPRVPSFSYARQGMVSGCYPLDAFYKALPEAVEMQQTKAGK